MTCQICLNPKRKPRFKSCRLVLCQWCVSEIIKDKTDTPKFVIESLRLNSEKDEVREILPIKRLANSQPTPPTYPQVELDRVSSISLREAARQENILTSLYRSFIDNQERIKEAEQIKLRKQREIIERYEVDKEAYRQKLM